MKRTLTALLLSLTLLLALTAPVLAAEAPTFEKVNVYTAGQFDDVPAGSRWAENVQAVCEFGLMGGLTADIFDTEGSLTIAQTAAMACRLHSAYCSAEPDLAEMVSAGGSPWYKPYLDYAAAHEFASFDNVDNFNTPITRGDFAGLMWAATPQEVLPAINSVEDGAIPDVPMGDYYAEPVYTLYRAGILTGNDAYGTYTPDSTISRGAVAAIVSRIAAPALRRSLTLAKQPFRPVPMAELANLKSLRKNANDEELSQAYAEALKIVTPLADLPREEQLYGIAVALRQRFEDNMSYSMETPHYNDPYGYLILGSASCAGCTRATGLCLNILGIPYEHVNENQYSHQWCRVNLGGVYWICDAYGLYCGPEPAPYTHPYL